MTRYYKMSGAGNDFLALADPPTAPAEAEIRAWCRRGLSLGADGLFVLRHDEQAEDPVVAMDYWNADGRPADLCLNGTRCAAQLAFALGWAADEVVIATPAGPLRARRLDATRIALEVPAPAAVPRPLDLEQGATAERLSGWTLTVGVPHLVVPWPDLDRAPVVALGRPARFAPQLGPAGANVDFVRFTPPGRLEIRTYERGVEDETLACGTGVLAGVAVGLRHGGLQLPVTVLTRGGFALEVAAREPGGDPFAGPWILAGDARLLAAGEILPAAAAGPVPTGAQSSTI
jgi:diaminopimelate epimerase